MMAARGAAPPIALRSSPPPVAALDPSPSAVSSPLSEVEDKDSEPDEMDIDVQVPSSEHSGTPNRRPDGDKGSPAASASASDGGDEGDADADADDDDDDDSNLSELDLNDSEAETERLYDTPPKGNTARDIVNGAARPGGEEPADRRDRVFERSPSKLQQQIQADVDAENEASDNESLSHDDDEEDDNDDDSAASSEPDTESPTAARRAQSPSKGNKDGSAKIDADTKAKEGVQSSADQRKRKRLSGVEPSDGEQPPRKRTGSFASREPEGLNDDSGSRGDEQASERALRNGKSDSDSQKTSSKEQSPDKDTAAASIETEDPEALLSRKSTRGSSRKNKEFRKSPIGDLDPNEQAVEAGSPSTADDDLAQTAEDETHEADADEEADSADKNEEELEKKTAAWEQLTDIEKHFTTFRDKLYQERLDQLNEEEAMLLCDSPTHPEYLAMMECIDARRDERIRQVELEYRLKMDVLRKRGVAERAQIMSQFYQSVRENREKTLEDLGRKWYEVQHERRRHANNIPDFGIRYPSTRTQAIKNAVAYNKEVSVLAGVAKYKGFPAAPSIHGASAAEIDDDMKIINRARQTAQAPVQAPYQEYGVLAFGRSLGPAAEQFLEQTPWANPNHPAHQAQRQQQLQQEQASSTTGPSPASGGKRRQSQQQTASNANAGGLANGDSVITAPISSSAPPVSKASKGGHETMKKREPVAQAA